jgi:hypothetical protein
MGIGMDTIAALDAAGAFRGGDCRVLDVGPQNVYHATPAEVLGFLRKYARRPDDPALPAKAADLAARSYSTDPATLTYLSEVLAETTIGYDAVDIFAGPKTRIVDLNVERLPRSFRGRFDLVFNCGTTEHLFGQLAAFRAVHEAVRVGGHMYHHLPATGFLNHGYFLYHPRVFGDLAAANGYALLGLHYTPVGGAGAVKEADPPPNLADPARFRATARALFTGPPIPDTLLSVLMRKENADPFRLRLETMSTLGHPARRIARRYGLPVARPPRIGTARWVLKALGVGDVLRRFGLR